MPKEQKKNLAIYLLAGSILISSVLVSMNQVNAHTVDTTGLRALTSDYLRFKQCVNLQLRRIYISSQGTPLLVSQC